MLSVILFLLICYLLSSRLTLGITDEKGLNFFMHWVSRGEVAG